MTVDFRKPDIILASASPRRAQIMSSLGIPFKVCASDICEENCRIKDPLEFVRHTAELKTSDVSARYPDSIVIGADTIVVLEGEILGKPTDKENAAMMLKKLSGRTHTVFTSVCVKIKNRNIHIQDVASTDVQFKLLNEFEIGWYLNTSEWTDKAGAYGIQGKASLFVTGIKGCYFNVVGFPVSLFCRLMTELEKDFLSRIKL